MGVAIQSIFDNKIDIFNIQCSQLLFAMQVIYPCTYQKMSELSHLYEERTIQKESTSQKKLMKNIFARKIFRVGRVLLCTLNLNTL